MNITPENVQQIVEIGLQIVGLASMAAAFVPNPQRVTGILAIARNVLNFIAFNFGHAKNKE